MMIGDILSFSKDLCIFVGENIQGFLCGWVFHKITLNIPIMILHMESHFGPKPGIEIVSTIPFSYIHEGK